MSTAARFVPTELTVHEIAASIDHSLLRPELTDEDVCSGCALAERYGTWAVCVRPADVTLASRQLAGTKVVIGTVVGFPHGSSTTESKLFEAAARSMTAHGRSTWSSTSGNCAAGSTTTLRKRSPRL